MHPIITASLLLIGTVSLGGCSGTSGSAGSSTDPEFDPTFSSFDEIEAALEPAVSAVVRKDGTLRDVAHDNISDSTDFDTLTVGSVTYKGAVIAEEVSDGGTLMGQLLLTADLDTSAIDGRAGNFFHSIDGEVTGSLLGASTFTENAGQDGDHFKLQLTGTLDTLGTSYDTTLDMKGNFFNDANSVGQVAGDADFDFGDGGPEYEQGAFQASR